MKPHPLTPNPSPACGRGERSESLRDFHVKKRVAVIGGGWAGCAAAVRLAQAGRQVTLYEAARTLGGRARRVEFNGKTIDNGQHILLGAYRQTLELMRSIGIDERAHLLRLPLQMRYPAGSGMDFVAPRLPAPWHMLFALWRARGLSRPDKLALARFSSTARWMGWKLNTDCSVSELLERFDQTPRLTALMWRPLCIAALNTPPGRASAQVFLNVLRDSLGAQRAASDMLIPRTDLSTLFPQQAASYVLAHGGAVHLGAAVRTIRQGFGDAGNWRVEADKIGPADAFDAVIIATSADRASRLLEGLPDSPAGALQRLRTQLNGFAYEPITTCYLQYAPTVRLPLAFMALQDDAASGNWGQFVFDRGQLNPAHAGLLAVVVSASEEAIALGREALGSLIGTQLAHALKQPGLANPQWSTVISEKRATFSCTPALERPLNASHLPGLLLAGDYTASDYPATLESATRSGMQAAQCLLA